MNEQDLRVIKTKNNLKNALIILLKEKPLEKINVTELCHASGITRKTFYLHYESISKLFEEKIEQLLVDLEASLLATSKYRLEADHHRLEPQMIHLFQHVYDNQDFYRFMFSAGSNFAYYEMFFMQIKKLVKKSLDSMATFGRVSEFEMSYHANAILGVIMEWYYHNFEETIDEMNQLLLKILKL
ncbi:AcrR family transcriptional regulator [Paenibacillus sp. V4I3]|uniref:TetR/AcrR family transcriptional regulator n=1 Tax=unclassified Paenibacillus TaxID=185978 RepID=UPI00278056D2|nr:MULTISPECIES: TetR-like C-terminal domain-containing protein [unclassified Paenibacillus]MDQ0877492.1 AcrR family transcriptional regulator [Paenibacillus sp. V4I3]MDQ0886643.1 AcrR family transcriptional regulator [Paenibacillus sp. V4I9]